MSVSIENLIPLTRKDIEDVRKIYGKSESDIRSDIEVIRNWIKKQQHLPQEHDDARLERFLLRNKFRLEQTKKKLELYYSLRPKFPEFFEILNLETGIFSNIVGAIVVAPLPKLTPQMERSLIIKATGENLDVYRLQDVVSFILLLMEVQCSHDYAVGERVILDGTAFTLTHAKTFSPTVLDAAVNLHKEVYSGRITGMHIINAPTFLNTLMNLLRQVLPKKLVSKFHIHDKIEEIYEFIPKEILPSDYNGEERPSHEIYDDFCELLKLKWDYLQNLSSTVSNEELRVGEVAPNDQFGVEGSFKNLLLD